MLVGIIADGDRALRCDRKAPESDPQQGRDDLKARNLTSNDVVVGIAVSAAGPPMSSAEVEYAWSVGATRWRSRTIRFDHCGSWQISPSRRWWVEVVTGSTRMKSGTAQKLILNSH